MLSFLNTNHISGHCILTRHALKIHILLQVFLVGKFFFLAKKVSTSCITLNSGDATCNPLNCESTRTCTGKDHQREPFLATGDNWLGVINDPQGASTNWSPEGIHKIWDSDIIPIIRRA